MVGSPLRVMVDANVLVSATGWPRFPYEVIQHAIQGDYELLLTSEIISEAREAVEKVLPSRVHLFDEMLQNISYAEVAMPTDDEVLAAQLERLSRQPGLTESHPLLHSPPQSA